MIRKTLWVLAIFLLSPLFIGPVLLDAATVYKYKNKEGTICFVDDPDKIPPDYRENVKKIEFEDRSGTDKEKGTHTTQDSVSTKKGIFAKKKAQVKKKGDELKDSGKRYITKCFNLVSSFFQDKRIYMITYTVGGVILFLVLSFIMKKYIDSFGMRFAINIVFMITFFSFGYLLYMSYMSEKINFFDRHFTDYRSHDGGDKPHKIITPIQIIDRAKAVADEMDQTIRQREKILNELQE